MKKVLTFLLFIAAVQCNAGPLVRFRISKPVCLLTFLQAATGDPRMSRTYGAYVLKSIPKEDADKFAVALSNFLSIGFDLSYSFPYYPDTRIRPKSTQRLISIAAVQSESTEDFLQRIIGILPNEQWLKLKNAFSIAEPIYDKAIFQPNKKATLHQLAELEKYSSRANDIFDKLKHFYGSTWTSDIPFTISIYPIPGSKGNTTATPHSNSIILAVLTEEPDHAMRMSVAIHEQCHILFEEQPLATQLRIDSVFSSSRSDFSKYAYGYLDEGLATACGNAWAYKQLTGKEDTTAWYDDAYIDGFAHALYPLVTEYMDAGRQMDKAFVQKAIKLFEQRFPRAIYSYENLLNIVNIYTDAADQQEFNSVTGILQHFFRITGSNSSYPVSDPQTLAAMDHATGTQLFIIHTNHDENYKLLKSKFPQMKNANPHREGLTSFFDNKERPIIIINVSDISRIAKGVAQMDDAKEIDYSRFFQPLE